VKQTSRFGSVAAAFDPKRASPEMRAPPVLSDQLGRFPNIVALLEVAEPNPGKRGPYG
jgi:hypothetical protein